ncbi:hypothetical protein [Streptomyces sp. NK08204]|nr:hypothetical protein [Streptomyces sp. NK08204]
MVSPVNTRSQRFRLSTGFQPVPLEGWDGPGEDRIRFSYAL